MLVVVRDGRRLCQDGYLREFANFGTFPECVKEYRKRGWAERKAKEIGGQVVEIYRGQSMDASGNIIKD